MKTRILYFLSSIVLSFLPSIGFHAQTVQQMFESKAGIKPPYLVLNIKSTDCVMCRGTAFNVMDNTTRKDRILVLFDDSVMSLYASQNQHHFKGYKILYDNVLSNMLSPGPTSNAVLITDTLKHISLSNLSKETIAAINQQLNKGNALAQTVDGKIVNNAFAHVKFSNANYILNEDQSLLFNYRAQVGFYNMRTVASDPLNTDSRYIQPEYADATERTLQQLVQSVNKKKIITDSLAGFALKSGGISGLIIKNINYDDGKVSAGFQLNTVTNTLNTMDTVRLAINSVYFIGFGPDKIKDALNTNLYSNFYLIDTIHFEGLHLQSRLTFGYYLHGDKLYVPFFATDSAGFIKSPVENYLVELQLKKDAVKPQPKRLFPLTDYNHNPKESILFKTDEAANPFTVFMNKRVVYMHHLNKYISFSDLLGTDATDNAGYLLDISINKNLVYTAFIKNDTVIKSEYNIAKAAAKKRTSTVSVNDFAGGKFIGNKLRLFRKDPAMGRYTFYDLNIENNNK